MGLTTSNDTVKFIRAIGINTQDWLKIQATKLSDDVSEVFYDNIRLFPLRYNDRIKAEKELATFFYRAEAGEFPVDPSTEEGQIELLSKYHPWANKGWAMSIYDLIDLYANDIGFKAIPYTELSPKDRPVLEKVSSLATDQLYNYYFPNAIGEDSLLDNFFFYTGLAVSSGTSGSYDIVSELYGGVPIMGSEAAVWFRFNETGNQVMVSWLYS